jgi:hypothetical protein
MFKNVLSYFNQNAPQEELPWYEGDTKRNLDGKEVVSYKTRAIVVNTIQKDGVGQYKDKNGNVYQGQWQDDQRSGFGQQTYATGERYRGTHPTSASDTNRILGSRFARGQWCTVLAWRDG